MPDLWSVTGWIVGFVSLAYAIHVAVESSRELRRTATQLMDESRQLRTLINALGHHRPVGR